MERTERASKIQAEALAAGISEKRLDNDIRMTYLPPTGQFTDYEIVGSGTSTAHIRLNTSDGNSISVGTLKALAFKGSKDDATFRKVENPESPMNGKFVLTGTSAVNPEMGGKMADLADRLIGKQFEATPEERVTLPYNANGYESEAKAKKAVVTKTFYRVILK